METQRPLHLIELFRATQSRRGFLLSCYSSSLFRNDCRRSSELAPDSPQDEGRLLPLAACHVSVKRVSNYLHGWNKVRISVGLRFTSRLQSTRRSSRQTPALLLISIRWFVRRRIRCSSHASFSLVVALPFCCYLFSVVVLPTTPTNITFS